MQFTFEQVLLKFHARTKASLGEALAAIDTPPSAAYPLGTDDLGRDLLASVIHGARTSALVVLTVTCVATLVGVPIGALAGY